MKLSKIRLKYLVLAAIILFLGFRLVRCNHDYEHDTPQNNLKEAEWIEFGDEVVFGDWKLSVSAHGFDEAESSRVDFKVRVSCEYSGSGSAYFHSTRESSGIIFNLIYDDQYEYSSNLTSGAFWQEQYLPLEKKTDYVTFEVPEIVMDETEKPLVFIIRENTVKDPIIYAFKIR